MQIQIQIDQSPTMLALCKKSICVIAYVCVCVRRFRFRFKCRFRSRYSSEIQMHMTIADALGDVLQTLLS